MSEKQGTGSVVNYEANILEQVAESSPVLQATAHQAFSQEPLLSSEDLTPLPLVASFVDVLLWGEWTAGFLLEVREGVATVVVNDPYTEEKRIQVPMEEIAVFRSKSSRSSLVTHLDACIWKYAHIDLSRELQSFLDTPSVSEDRLVQVFAGVLPIGCALWKADLPPEEWDMESLALICIAITEFLTRIAASQVSMQTVYRIWASLSDTESIVFPSLKTTSGFSQLCETYSLVVSLENFPCCAMKIDELSLKKTIESFPVLQVTENQGFSQELQVSPEDSAELPLGSSFVDVFLEEKWTEPFPVLQATENQAFYQEPQISPKDSTTFPLVSSFVDVFLEGEWIAGFLLEVRTEFATVVVSGLYLEEKRIQVPMEEIAVFRSKSSRNILASHLDTWIWKYTHIDMCHELQSFLDTPNESEDRLIQVFAGVLPIGCAVWNSCLSPEEWDKKSLALICIALTQFLTRIVSSQVSITALSRTWRSVSNAETIVLPLLKTLPEFPALLKVHFQVIALKDCPGCVIHAFQDLMHYCCPPRLAWIMPDDTELPKVPLHKDTLYVYGKAAIKCLEYCIDDLDWFESFRILFQILIVNVQSDSPILNSEKLNALLRDITSFESPETSQMRSNMALLLFSPPCKTDTLSNENLLFWFSICSTACTDLLSKAPISISLAFLQNCQSIDTDSELTRMITERPNYIFEKLVIRASERTLIPLFHTLKSVFKNRDKSHSPPQSERYRTGTLPYFLFIKKVLLLKSMENNGKYPEHWHKMMNKFLCAELTSFFTYVKSFSNIGELRKTWQTVEQIQRTILKSMPNDCVENQRMLVAYVEALSNENFPDDFLETFTDLKPYFEMFAMRPEFPQLSQAFKCATLASCIQAENWHEALKVILGFINSHSKTQSESKFDSLQLYLEQSILYFETTLQLGGYSYNEIGSLKKYVLSLFIRSNQLEVLFLWNPREFTSVLNCIILTCFLCLSFLDLADSGLFARVTPGLLIAKVKEIVGRIPRNLAVSIWFIMRRHGQPYYLRKVEEIANGIKLPRQFSLWIYEKGKLPRIPVTLIREIVLYI